jgi:hypothetical protein
MSQVRGRIKTVVKYNDQLNTVGTCCGSDGTKTEKSFSQCSAEGGRWVPVLPIEDVECPNVSDRGCCCSCAYTTKNTGTPDDWTHPDHREDLVFRKRGSPDGLRDNISRCECSYYEGNWNEGECPSSEQEIRDFCYLDPDVGVEGRDDVRWPFACCHCEYDANDEVYRECSSVCLSRDCAALGEGFEGTGFNCIPEFDPFKICDYEFNGQPKECPEVEDAVFGCTNPACDNYDPNADYDDGSCSGCDDGGGGTGPEEPTGACCQGTQCTDNLTAAQCVGLGGSWQGPTVSCVSDPCNSSPPPPPPPPPPGTILGCTDPTASNYNPEATEDDGTCEYSPPPPPPPELICSNGGSSYTVEVDVSGLGWVDENNNSVDTVFRPTDNDGSITDEGPLVYQQYAATRARGRSPFGSYGACSSWGCGRWCSNLYYRRGYFASMMAHGFAPAKRTLGLDSALKCRTICNDGPGDNEESQQRIDWDLATKRLTVPSDFYGSIFDNQGDTGAIVEDGEITETIGVQWGCKRNYKHAYRCNQKGFDPYIIPSYVSLDRDLSPVLDGDGNPTGETTPPDETLDAYIDLRSLDDVIKPAWDEYFSQGVREFAPITYAQAVNGDYAGFIQILQGDIPDTYDPFNLPIPELAIPEIYENELVKQYDFNHVDANLNFRPDNFYFDLGNTQTGFIPLVGRQDCDNTPNGEISPYETWVDQVCEGNNPNPFRRFGYTRAFKLPVVDPPGGEVIPKTKRCFDICMESDAPIHLKKYDDPTLGRAWSWLFGYWSQWGDGSLGDLSDCNKPFVDESSPTDAPNLRVYARSYEQAKSKCEDLNIGVLSDPIWPPEKVTDFYYVKGYSRAWGWSECLDRALFCDFDTSVYNCLLEYLERRLFDYSAYALPTASLLADTDLNYPLSDPSGAAGGFSRLDTFEPMKNLQLDPANCDPESNDLENCVVERAYGGSSCAGIFSGRFLDRPSGYSYTNGPRGACLVGALGGQSWYSFGPSPGSCVCDESCPYSYSWHCCRTLLQNSCNQASCGGSGLLRQHPNAPRQPEFPRLPYADLPFLRETINQGKYIDPRQAGIEIPKSQDASACCVANYEGDKFTCSYMTRKDCEMQNGFFNIPDEDGPITCSKTICPALPTRSKSGFVTPPSIKSSDLPEPGKLFAGGVYIGTFKPGISQVLTSVETGSTGKLKTCSADGPGDKRSWAIILAPTDLGAEFGLDSMMYRYITASEKIPQTQTSLFDGLYNTYGNDKSVRQAKTSLMKQIKNYNLYGFKDWYLPSVEELGFVGAQQRDLDFGVNLGRYSQNQSKLGSDTPYMTSSRKISKKKPSKSLTRDFTSYPSANLVYGVLVGNSLGPMNGFTILSGLDNTFRVRLARRIYVED